MQDEGEYRGQNIYWTNYNSELKSRSDCSKVCRDSLQSADSPQIALFLSSDRPPHSHEMNRRPIEKEKIHDLYMFLSRSSARSFRPRSCSSVTSHSTNRPHPTISRSVRGLMAIKIARRSAGSILRHLRHDKYRRLESLMGGTILDYSNAEPHHRQCVAILGIGAPQKPHRMAVRNLTCGRSEGEVSVQTIKSSEMP